MAARLLARASAALNYARCRGVPGLEFARFGRRVGWRLLAKRSLAGAGYLLTPVNIVRYFEFPFAYSCLPSSPGRCLDVSSPRLFSLYVASKKPSAFVRMINPDPGDIRRTASIVSKLALKNVRTENFGVDALSGNCDAYDCIWAISVAEHISGGHDDTDAVKLMYGSLRRGGRLILTVPVDRSFRDEHRDGSYYGTRPESSDGRYFFQRLYDRAAVWERLVAPVSEEPKVLRWFGETCAGRFAEYERRWMREGHRCTVEDPREIAGHYQEFASWEDMPGMGVCGLMIEKTRQE